MPEQSKSSWLELWQSLGAKGSGEPCYNDLAARYDQTGRAYHNLSHIVDCLGQFELVKQFARNPNAVKMAIWFHDAIYDSRAKDNEEKSAALADNMLSQAEISAEFRKSVRDLVMATKSHVSAGDDDAQIIIDVDLSILGRDPERFDEYERQIRSEYSWVADEAFAAGRATVMQGFLARPRIYGSSIMVEKYETTARQNLARSIKKWRGI